MIIKGSNNIFPAIKSLNKHLLKVVFFWRVNDLKNNNEVLNSN